MNDITIHVDAEDILTIRAPISEIGSQYDHREQRLVFERPERFVGTELVLYFVLMERYGCIRIDTGPIVVGENNSYVLKSDITKYPSFQLQIAYKQNSVEIARSNIITLYFRDSLSEQTEGLPPTDIRIGELEESAFTTVEYEDDALTFRNMFRDIVGSVDIASGGYSPPIDGIPKNDLATDVQNSLNLANTALQSFTETDPTVPEWAKSPEKPVYTANEIGAAESIHTHLKSNILDFSDDDYATAAQGILADTALQQEEDPTVPAWAKFSTKPTYTAEEVGAATSSDVVAAIEIHNASNISHEDKFAEKLNISGGTMEGRFVAQQNAEYDIAQVRNAIISDIDLEDGISQLANGILYFVYE